MLAEEGERDLGYARVGGLYVPEDVDRVGCGGTPRAGPCGRDAGSGTIERLSPADARGLFPPLGPDQPALFVSGGARVDGRRVAAALQRAAVKRGARQVSGSAELILRDGKAAGVRVDGQSIEADAVVVAAGAWAPKILEAAGVQLAVAPQRGQIVHLRLPGTDTARWPILMPLNSYYLLAFENSRVVIGATREVNSGFDYRLTAAGVAEVLNAGLAVAPGLASWTVHEIRIGFRPIAHDNRPKLGRVPGVDNLLVGNGLGPSGLSMGPYSGALLANAALGKPTELELGPYAVAE